MFLHIPEEIFCPQVSGNLNDALRVLKVSVKGPEKNSHFFDLELSLVDPENPVTQVSKTPSDEEFPWCGENTDADVPSTPKEHEQVSKPQLMEEFIMESREKKSLDENDKLKNEELGDIKSAEVGEEQGGGIDNPGDKETNILDDKEANISKIIDGDEIHGEKSGENEKETESVDVDMTDKESEKKDANLDAKDKEMDLLEVPKIEETGTESQASSDVSSTMDLLEVPKVEETDTESQAPTDVSSIEDSAVKEKREKEEKVTANYKSMAFPKRPRSTIKTELLVKDVKKFIEDMKKQTAPEDLDVRIIPSNMACRFELPIDLTRLKGETPLSYLRKYCRVTESRKTVYKEKYEHFKTELSITLLNLQKIYEILYHGSGLWEDVMHLQRLLGLDLGMELDVETFIPVSCLMERIILRSQGKGPAQGYKKNVFEVTSFSALTGKLQNIEISSEMMDFLQYIRGT